MSIERFNGGDFKVFSLRLRMALTAHNVWTVVSGDEKQPDGKDAAVLRAWVEKSNKALGMIASALSDAVLLGSGIATCTTAADAWEKLLATYSTRTTTSKLLLREQFTQLRMHDDDDVQQFSNRVNSLVDELAAAGIVYDETEIVSRVLLGLPPQFAPLVTALENMPEKELSKSYVFGRLQHEEQKQRQQTADRGRGSAMVVRTGGGVQQQQQHTHSRQQFPARRAPRTVTCYYCDKPGHIVRDCAEMKAAVAERKRTPHAHAATADAAAGAASEADNVYLFAAGSSKPGMQGRLARRLGRVGAHVQ